MKHTGGWALRVGMLLSVLGVPGGLSAAQELSEQVLAVESGRVAFEFPVREGVQLCNDGIQGNSGRVRWNVSTERRSAQCSDGVGVAVLRVARGQVAEIELRPTGGTEEGRFLGVFSGREAADFFLMLARTGAGGVAEDAVAPAALADAGPVWRELLALATDRDLDAEVRKGALFWVGQQAADAVTEKLEAIVRDDPQADIRGSAVFALSQRTGAESVPILMDLAKTSEFPDVRRSALFWLAQSGDERVPGFFAEILGD